MDRRENMKDYVSIVISKQNSKRTFLISIIALLVSLFTLFINYIYDYENIKGIIQSEDTIQGNNYIHEPSSMSF